jgi:hypothetical protein
MTNYDVNYRYYLTDLLSNQVIAELPLTSVSYERKAIQAGNFSGTIPVIEATKKYDLYETTMPGRTGIYVLRNGQCVWGGIIWSRSYDEGSKSLTIDASEFTSYLYHRVIWKTLTYGSEFFGVSSFTIQDGFAIVELEQPHNFDYGDFVRVTFTSPLVDGTHEVSDINGNSFSFQVDASDTGVIPSSSGAARKLYDTYDFVRDIIDKMNTDFSEYYGSFGNELIEPAQAFEVSVVSKKIEDGVVTLKTATDHGLVPGQEFDIYGIDQSLEEVNPWDTFNVPDARTIIIENAYTDDVPETPLSGIRTLFINSRSVTDGVATITTHIDHNAQIGQVINISGVDSPFNQRLDINFDGQYVITDVTSNTISFTLETIIDVPFDVVAGGLVSFGSKVRYYSYGPYKANSDLFFTFDNSELSGKYQDTQVLRGYETKTVGEILEEYTDNTNGFDYRVDCDYDPSTGSFQRIFTILDRENPNGSFEYPNVPSSELTDEQRIGYNKLVFEYPGNISTFSLEENADTSATRYFIQGNITDLSDAASQPYAIASDIELLNNRLGRSFPLIDKSDNVNNTADEDVLYSYAQERLFEAKIPEGTIDITVNGSITPTVGSYSPGDWCTIIIDDPFVLSRLASDQEPREDILVRRIESYSVNVPDSSFIPESVKLVLATDWEVDKTGQAAGLSSSGGN